MAKRTFLLIVMCSLFIPSLVSVLSTSQAQESNPFPNGVASGDTTQTTTVLWTRSTTLGTLTFEVATDPDFSAIVITQSAAVTDATLPVKVQIEGLTPATQYHFRVTDSGGATQVGAFRTAAETGTFAGLRFGVSGDWRGELSPYAAITNVAAANLDFFVLHGDTIYADVASPAVPKAQAITLEEYRAKHAEVYGERAGFNVWAEIRATTSVLATIDDHEVTNDFSGGASPETDPRFADGAAEFVNDATLYETGMQAFQEYNPLRDEFYGETGDPRTAGERKLYRAMTYGSDAAVFVIDTRSFRDGPIPDVTDFSNQLAVLQFLRQTYDPARTFLGAQQFQDLQNDLLAAHEAGITWKFVMVPEPIQNLGVVASSDRYEGYNAERTALLKFIRDNQITNVVFVAADIHGTIVNNLHYQERPLGDMIAVDSFEITTGAVAYYAPFGPTVVQLAADLGFIEPTQATSYLEGNRAAKEQFLNALLVGQLTPLGFTLPGLDDSALDAELLQGGYTATSTFGWTLFEIDAATQQLRVTTYGIDPYSPEEVAADPATIMMRTPEVVSEFIVNPQR